MVLLETRVYHPYLKTNASEVCANAYEVFIQYKKIYPAVPEEHVKKHVGNPSKYITPLSECD